MTKSLKKQLELEIADLTPALRREIRKRVNTLERMRDFVDFSRWMRKAELKGRERWLWENGPLAVQE